SCVYDHRCVALGFTYTVFFFSSRRRHTRFSRDWSSDVCSSDLSSLDKGTIKIKLHSKTIADFDNVSGKLEKAPGNELVYLFDVTGGVVEMSNNVVTILAN